MSLSWYTKSRYPTLPVSGSGIRSGPSFTPAPTIDATSLSRVEQYRGGGVAKGEGGCGGVGTCTVCITDTVNATAAITATVPLPLPLPTPMMLPLLLPLQLPNCYVTCRCRYGRRYYYRYH